MYQKSRSTLKIVYGNNIIDILKTLEIPNNDKY